MTDLHPHDSDPVAGVARQPDGTHVSGIAHHEGSNPADGPALVDGAGRPIDARALHERLEHIAAHVERLAGAHITSHQPAWLRRTAEEPRLPVMIAVACAIALQAFVPHSLAFHPWWLLPGLEALLGVTIFLFRQTKINRESSILRALSLSLVIAASLATAWSAVQLIDELIRNTSLGGPLSHAGPLLRIGGGIWLTNVIVFALWYWDLDRGGPVARACGACTHTDFLFAQMTAPEFVAKDWEPHFVDYLYLSFTNSTAFSPTDTLPLSRWAKLTMMFQSAVSIGTIALVIARAVNVLP